MATIDEIIAQVDKVKAIRSAVKTIKGELDQCNADIQDFQGRVSKLTQSYDANVLVLNKALSDLKAML